MKIFDEPFPGFLVVSLDIFKDQRGTFVKTFHSTIFEGLGWRGHWEEEFYSTSAKDVIRGMHFQTPPHQHDKLIYCAFGKVLDVALDLRTNSPTHKKVFSIELSSTSPCALLLPAGIAHGFLSLEENSLMVYKTTKVYSPDHDSGIHWNSFGFCWPVSSPIVSARDMSFPALENFRSPF